MNKNSLKEETQNSIADALIGLSLSKPLSSISVTELCEKAGVSRMAFYRNFASKEDVLLWKMNSLVEEYRRATSTARAKGSPWFGIDHLSVCFLFLKQNNNFIDSLYRCGYAQLLVDTIAKYMIDTWGNGTPKGDYVLAAFAGSICSTYAKWKERDYRESPQQLADIISRFYTALPAPKEQIKSNTHTRSSLSKA